VSLASLGMPRPEYIERNTRVAASFKALSDGDRKRLSDSIGAELKVSMRRFFADHLDA
jgi:hypothetical protein